MYDYLLFDLDGTLTDPGEGITNSVVYALKKWGIEVADKRELYVFIGPPLSASFKQYFGFSEADALKCVDYSASISATEASLKIRSMTGFPRFCRS